MNVHVVIFCGCLSGPVIKYSLNPNGDRTFWDSQKFCYLLTRGISIYLPFLFILALFPHSEWA